MNTRVSAAGLVLGLAVGMACSAVLDFEVEIECWCGERWMAQIAGAEGLSLVSEPVPIAASSTTHEVCVTQLEHLALDAADPLDPLYLALRDSLESGAIANCESAAQAALGPLSVGSTCGMSGVGDVSTNITHVGACWETETLAPNGPEPCGAQSQCRAFYDCTEDAIIGSGGDEAGGDETLWSCAPQ